MNYIVINQFNSDNIGDKLIGISIKQFFDCKGDNVRLIGFAQTTNQKIEYNPDTNAGMLSFIKKIMPSYMKYHLYYRKRINYELKKIDINVIDGIVIGGGQLFKHSGLFPFCFDKWSQIAKKNKIKLYIYGVGVDNNLSSNDIKKYRKGIEYATYVACRDDESAKQISQIVQRNVEVWPDVVFSFDIEKSNAIKDKLLIMPYNYETAHNHFHSLESRERYYEQLIKLVGANDYSNVFLSATTSSDLKECYVMRDYLKSNGIQSEIVNCDNYESLIELYKTTKTVISGRMHAMIIAMLCGVNIIPIEISPKITDFKHSYLESQTSLNETINLSKKGLEKLYIEMNSKSNQ